MLKIFLLKLCICIVWVRAYDIDVRTGAHRSQRSPGAGVTGSFEHLTWVLGTGLVSSARQIPVKSCSYLFSLHCFYSRKNNLKLDTN